MRTIAFLNRRQRTWLQHETDPHNRKQAEYSRPERFCAKLSNACKHGIYRLSCFDPKIGRAATYYTIGTLQQACLRSQFPTCVREQISHGNIFSAQVGRILKGVRKMQVKPQSLIQGGDPLLCLFHARVYHSSYCGASSERSVLSTDLNTSQESTRPQTSQ